jgi:ring-1,2-phenylacetyl-CoA epoxidase subunit PaaC
MNKEEITFQYLLHLGDNSLILGQRNAEWCGHGPVLEQDIALTNISLDLFGESRNIYQYAAQLKGDNHTEDTLAFLRDVLDFKNVLLVEQPNIDWAYTICRQFFFDAFHYLLQHELLNSKDEKIVEIANKTIKESAYHLKWSSEWMIRLGDGTDISHQKIQNAVNDLWEFTGELFIPSDIETAAFECLRSRLASVTLLCLWHFSNTFIFLLFLMDFLYLRCYIYNARLQKHSQLLQGFGVYSLFFVL